MDLGVKGWALLAVGAFAGGCLVLLIGPVRDLVFDVVDAVVGWWWDMVDAARRALVWMGMLLLVGLAMWAVVALVLPRLVK